MTARREWNLIEIMLERTMQEVLEELFNKYVCENYRFDYIEYHMAYYGDTDRFYKEENGTYITLKPKQYQISAENCSYQKLYVLVEDRILLNANGKRKPIIYIEGFKVKGSYIDINMCVDYLD